MWTLAVAVALSVALPAASGPRIPGLALRFGESLGRVDSTQSWRAEVSGVPGVAVRSGTARFFGVPAALVLRFEGERLVRAEATVEGASPRDEDQFRDELRRLGLRAACEADLPGNRRCTWTGRALVRLEVEGTRVHAVLEPAPAPAPPAVTGAGPATPASADPDTLPALFVYGSPDAPGRAPQPVALVHPGPVYPEPARRAGLMGRIRVIADVDTTGAVVAVVAVNSVPGLDRAALDSVRRWRFAPYVHRGRARAIRVEIPVVFTLR